VNALLSLPCTVFRLHFRQRARRLRAPTSGGTAGRRNRSATPVDRCDCDALSPSGRRDEAKWCL